MKSTLKNHLFCLFSYAVGLVASTILTNTIILTICNIIWKQDTAALLAAQVISRILLFGIAFVMIYVYKKRDDDEMKSFLAQMKEKEYNSKNDFRDIIKNKKIRAEIVFVSIITIVYWVFHFTVFWLFWNIPLFFIFELLANHHLHKAWLKEEKKEKIY